MKSYKEFIRESKDTTSVQSVIREICKQYNINNYTINSDGSINVGGSVHLNNKSLTKLPLRFERVTGYFDCSNNQLTSLEGSPKSVDSFYCNSNKLTSLEGCPQSVSVYLNCRENQITDFRGVAEFFEGLFYCEGNPIEEIYRLFIKEDKHITDFSLLYGLDGLSKCIKWINEFDVIQGNKVIMDRLEEVFYQLGMEIPENINLPSYEII